MPTDASTGAWLLLVHSLPQSAAPLRRKIAHGLQRSGAVSLRSSVYALPSSGPAREDFSWLARLIEREGGKAFVCEARFVEGVTDQQVVASFNAARRADYEALAEEARRALKGLPELLCVASDEREAALRHEAASVLARLRERLAELASIDFFDAPGREAVDDLLEELAGRLEPPRLRSGETLQGRVWVTLEVPQAERLASAWLIQRFFDPQARFRFVASETEPLAADEIRFATGRQELAPGGIPGTFEGLVRHLGLDHRGLREFAEIVRDLGCADGAFARLESAGLALVFAGIVASRPDMEACRLRCATLFDELFEGLQRRETSEREAGPADSPARPALRGQRP